MRKKRLILLVALGFTASMQLAAQLPEVSTADNPKWYYIQVLGSDTRVGRVFTAEGSKVYGREISASIDPDVTSKQLWRFEKNANGSYVIVNKSTGLQLDLDYDASQKTGHAALAKTASVTFTKSAITISLKAANLLQALPPPSYISIKETLDMTFLSSRLTRPGEAETTANSASNHLLIIALNIPTTRRKPITNSPTPPRISTDRSSKNRPPTNTATSLLPACCSKRQTKAMPAPNGVPWKPKKAYSLSTVPPNTSCKRSPKFSVLSISCALAPSWLKAMPGQPFISATDNTASQPLPPTTT